MSAVLTLACGNWSTDPRATFFSQRSGGIALSKEDVFVDAN